MQKQPSNIFDEQSFRGVPVHDSFRASQVKKKFRSKIPDTLDKIMANLSNEGAGASLEDIDISANKQMESPSKRELMDPRAAESPTLLEITEKKEFSAKPKKLNLDDLESGAARHAEEKKESVIAADSDWPRMGCDSRTSKFRFW